MKKVNNNNRYYCHRRMQTGKLDVRNRRILLLYSDDPVVDRYAVRLRDVYHYAVQLIIE